MESGVMGMYKSTIEPRPDRSKGGGWLGGEKKIYRSTRDADSGLGDAGNKPESETYRLFRLPIALSASAVFSIRIMALFYRPGNILVRCTPSIAANKGAKAKFTG